MATTNETKTASLPLVRFLPFLSWASELSDKQTLRTDIIAGITVALVLIPQSMAYAQLAGLPAYYGLYASFLPPVVAALFGSSRQLATGPVAVVSLLSAAALEPVATAGSEAFVAYAIMLALMVGLFQLSLGLLRLGVLVNFLSHPVVLGFTNAAAIIIATSQLSKIFGVSVEKAAHHYETVWNVLVAAASDTHWPTLIMGVVAFTIMIVLRKINPRLPGVLIAVAVTTIAAWLIAFENIQTAAPDQLVDASARQLVNEQLELRAEIALFEKDVFAASERLKETREKLGVDDPQTLSALHALDEFKLKLDRRVKSAKADLRELRNVHFEYVPGADDQLGRYYLRGRVPAQATTDGNIWRLAAIEDDGALQLTAGGQVVGTIPRGLPAFRLPTFDAALFIQLLASAIAIGLIGFMEAISIAKAMATRTRQRLDANQELVGQGLSNIVGSMFQSYAVSGSFSRSAVNFSAGAITGFSSVVTGLVVVITLLFFTPLLYHLPQATLAAVIMLAVIGLVNVKALVHTWRISRRDGFVSLVTFVLALVFAPHLDTALMVGVGLSLMLYLYRTMKPRVAVLARHPDGSLRDAEEYGLEVCPNITVLRFDGQLYFANTSYFDDKVMERLSMKPDLQYIIVDMQGINQIDATGVEMLTELTDRLDTTNIKMLFTHGKKQVLDTLEQAKFVERFGAERFYRRTEHALERVWDELGHNHKERCPLHVPTPSAQS